MASGEAAAGKAAGPRAVARVLDLLLLLARRPDGLTLTELSAALTVPKSTFVDTLRGLCHSHHLTQEDGRFRLGPAAYYLASRIVGNWSAPEIVRSQVKILARETGESVGFAIADWELGQAIYTEAANSRQPVRYEMQAGLRAPLYASAGGRVLLAFSPSKRVDDYLARAHLRQLTERTRTDPDRLRNHLAEVRGQGFCASFGELLSDTAALAVPVFGLDRSVVGSLMLAAPLDRMKQKKDALLAALIRAGRHASSGQRQSSTPAPSDGR